MVIEDSEVRAARSLALRIHRGQVDEVGWPYAKWLALPQGVLVAAGADEMVLVTMWLRDSLTMGGVSARFLMEEGFSARVVDAVQVLALQTHGFNPVWADMVRADPVALAVKSAELWVGSTHDRAVLAPGRVMTGYSLRARLLGFPLFTVEAAGVLRARVGVAVTGASV